MLFDIKTKSFGRKIFKPVEIVLSDVCIPPLISRKIIFYELSMKVYCNCIFLYVVYISGISQYDRIIFGGIYNGR